MENTCDQVLNYGPNMGMKCELPIQKENRCERCIIRDELIQNNLNLNQLCSSKKDPYNNEKCERLAEYKGYCLLCLSIS